MTGLPCSRRAFGFGALAERVVENDDVGPVDVFLPIVGLGDEAVGDVALFFVADVIADFVAFFEDLPGDVADESGQRDKQKVLLFPSIPQFHKDKLPILYERQLKNC